MDILEKTQFQNKLLQWYDCSARILPWRDDASPYRVWVSEIMLQQTRVETVKPYFEHFIEVLPTIQDLAKVPEERLLKLWEGLGYYTRAKNLKKTAKIVVESGGQLPTDRQTLETLPGIGPYTSGAIASIAFGVKVSAVDGNVLRVMARVTANIGDIKNKVVKKEIEEIVNNILPDKRVGDFNQALMELGATICLPNRSPKCDQCPIQFVCQGYSQGIVSTIPTKSQKKPRKIEYKTIFLIMDEDNIALRQRSSKGLLSNLWEFPHVDGHLSHQECVKKMKEWNVFPEQITPLNKSKHLFTHLEWHMIGYLISINNRPEYPDFIWTTQREIKEKYSIPSALKEYVNFLVE